jgi:hypothetical protein
MMGCADRETVKSATGAKGFTTLRMSWVAVIERVVDVISALLVLQFHFAGRCAVGALVRGQAAPPPG